jgi:hypothetical protein
MGRAFRGAARRTAIAAALALVVAGIAYAAIPDPSGLIHGCYATKNGALRVIAPPAKCASTELALDWNQQGMQGPAGPKGDTGGPGPAGQAGPTGAQGPPGVVASGGSYGNAPSPLDTTQWADFRFLTTPVRVTLSSGDKVAATASAVFGTTKLLGATDLHLGICYRNPAATGYLRLGQQQEFFAPGPPGKAYYGLVADQYKPLPVSISMIFPAGTGDTDVGLCYQTTDGGSWDFNGSTWVSVQVLHS